jgi:hypothetical protein
VSITPECVRQLWVFVLSFGPWGFTMILESEVPGEGRGDAGDRTERRGPAAHHV